jgi:hypothetical protein
MKTRLGVILSILALLLASALAVVRPWESIQPGVAQTPPEDREYGYLDQGNDTYILAQWNPESPGFGGVMLSIDGLGAAWAETGLQVADGQDGTLVVSYSGAAELDAGAPSTASTVPGSRRAAASKPRRLRLRARYRRIGWSPRSRSPSMGIPT